MSQYVHGFDASNKRVKPVAVDTDGHLQVDVVSMTGGGDATAANQVTNHTKLDTLGTKLDTLDGSVNTIEGCVSAGELAVAHGGLTELASAINSQKVDVNIVSDGASLATSANQSTTNGHLAEIEKSVYATGDAVSASTRGLLAMGRDNSNNAQPIHITANGDVEVEIADFVKGQATMASSFPVVIASNQGALGVTHGAFTEIEGAINSNKMDVNIVSDGASLATSGNQTAMNANLSNILSDTTATKPAMSQVSLASSTLITSGSNTSEIDMDGFNHLTLYGSSDVNFGSLCLVRRSASGGTDFLDGSNMVSANDPTGGSNYHFAATFENVGARYIAFRNVDASSQTVTLFAERSR
jgi:hypothetical protein